MTSLFRRFARDAHEISKVTGDAAAYQSGGVPRLAKRVARRAATRKAFSLLRNFR